MPQGYRDEQDFRAVLDRAVDELPPLRDLVPGAVREGRRRRLRSRAVVGAVLVGTVAAVAAPTVLLPRMLATDSAPAGTTWTPDMPLRPSNWPTDRSLAAPTTAYPVTTWTPLEEGSDDQPTRSDVEFQYAYKQKVADVLVKLLPPEMGRMQVPNIDPAHFELTSERGTYTVMFDVRPLPPVAADPGSTKVPESVVPRKASGNLACTDTRVYQPPAGQCADGKMPDGTVFSVRNIGSASWDQPTPRDPWIDLQRSPYALFDYKDVQIMLIVSADGDKKRNPPMSVEQVARMLTDPSLLQVIEFRRTHHVPG
ncbi:hypothetical protein [Streptomyces sp. SID3343]|uniref:hypothetical protein n=1 Tax=Streptomyces sp. SID3343 TaxID=2690260 RepID=UPI00136AA7B5|nr:hypothetical protein [Streptomyces sp. SID3343]MYV97613.1 hypothetical protein [Streptomyces sp. SID3343]